MTDTPVKRIVRSDTPYCETHRRYYVLTRAGKPSECPVCRAEEDEGADLFTGKPETRDV